MSAAAASNLDADRFRKVHRLMSGGATHGERKAATARAEAMAARAGMTLKQAVSSLDSQPKPQPTNFFEGFDDWCEEREPGYKAREAAKKAERNTREDTRRTVVMTQYGSEDALFARTPLEVALEAAITPLATWEYWIDHAGISHRYADTLDGKKPKHGSWYREDLTPAIRDAVMKAYPWPSNLSGVLHEAQAWERLRLDRGLFNGGEWQHYAEVECRIELLEHALKGEQPAASWEDVQARFDWKRWEFSRQWLDPQEPLDPFMDRLEADIATLRATNPIKPGLSSEGPPHSGEGYASSAYPMPRTTAEKRTAILSMLDKHPELSDREIGRRLGVSPQTVNTWRKKRQAASSRAEPAS